MSSFCLVSVGNRHPDFHESSCRRLFVVSTLLALLFLSATGLYASGNATTQPAQVSENLQLPERKQVVIVGAGMAGLTAAYFLKDRDIALLEKSDHYGGIIDSGSFGGYNYPKGPAYIGIPQGPVETMIVEMALEPLEIPEPSQGFYYDGRFYFGTKEMAKLFIEKSSAEEYRRFVNRVKKLSRVYGDCSYSALPGELRELEKITSNDWFEREKFPPIYMEIYNSQACSVFGAGLEQISALSFIPEIGFQFESSESENDRNSVERNEENAASGKGSGAYTFRNGLSELPEAIVKKLGDKTRLECNVTNIGLKDKLYKVHYVDKGGIEHIIESEAVIIATPAPEALEIAGNLLNEEQKKSLGGIKYCGYISVALFCSAPIFDKSFDLGVGNGYVFSDIYDGSWVQRAYDKSLSELQERVICAHIPACSRDNNQLKGLSDEELVKKTVADLERIFPDAGSKIVGHDVKRIDKAYPVMRPGVYETIVGLNDINQGKALLAGQYMTYPTIESAAESGYLAAIKLDAALGPPRAAEAAESKR